MVRKKQQEVQHIKGEIKQLSETIEKRQDDIQSLCTQLECSITSMGDVEYNVKVKRLTELLETTIPKKEELRGWIKKKLKAEMELKRLKESSKHIPVS